MEDEDDNNNYYYGNTNVYNIVAIIVVNCWIISTTRNTLAMGPFPGDLARFMPQGLDGLIK